MRNRDYLPIPGLDLARIALARAAGRTTEEAVEFARGRWGRASDIVSILKGDVSGHETADPTFDPERTANAGAEFARVVDQAGLLRSGLVPVVGGLPFIGAVTDPGATFIANGKAIPVSRSVLDRETLHAKKVASLLVVTDELLAGTDPGVEALLLGQMLRSARRAIDNALTDPNNGGDAATPASITSTATSISSVGNLADDCEAAIAAYTGSLGSACWFMSSALATQAELRSGGFGTGAGLGVSGGVLAGLPCFASDGIEPTTSGSPLILVDRAQVALLDEGYSVARSTQSVIEFTDEPSGDIIAPATMAPKFASLFQNSATALLLVRRVNWHAALGAVVVVENCDYLLTT